MSILLALVVAVAQPAAEPLAGVRHEPASPKPGTAVVVTVRVAVGITRPILKLQAVAPGKYIRKSDPAYEKDWTDHPMHDNGKDGDVTAGDGIYSVRVPAEFSKHRWLVRYCVTATDAAGKPVRLPRADDTSPNYAWWCDAGPTAWTGSRQPGKAEAVTYPTAFLETLQSLHLLARMQDVARSQWDGGAHKQEQEGTLVYKGVVYDHIKFRNRGQGSAHIGGKNKWALKLNKGHNLPFADHDGIPFPDTCDKISLNPGWYTPYTPVHRGISGLDEVLSLRAYRLAGVPTPPATWVQWRVVTDPDEVSAKDQYAGDLWGLYVALGDMEPDLLAPGKLPDGLTVSIQSGIKHTPNGMQDGQKLWEKFLGEMRSNRPEEWWRANLNLRAYFSFHAMNRLLGNVDLRPDGNHGYYRHPDGRWSPIPWDNDMMFVPRTHQPGHIDAIGCLRHPVIALEYRNRAREILDLFAGDSSEDGGQVGQLARDLGRALTPAGHTVDWPRLDEAKWNHHPRTAQKGMYFHQTAESGHFGGPWQRTLATPDFAGFQKYIVDFCTDSRPQKKYAPNDGDPRGYGWGYLAHEARDDNIPATTKVERRGETFQFTASAFASPAGAKPATLEWRVGRVGKRGWYELEEYWLKQEKAGQSVDIPAEVFAAPGEYRVRARWRDDTGRCGHWSPPSTVQVR